MASQKVIYYSQCKHFCEFSYQKGGNITPQIKQCNSEEATCPCGPYLSSLDINIPTVVTQRRHHGIVINHKHKWCKYNFEQIRFPEYNNLQDSVIKIMIVLCSSLDLRASISWVSMRMLMFCPGNIQWQWVLSHLGEGKADLRWAIPQTPTPIWTLRGENHIHREKWTCGLQRKENQRGAWSLKALWYRFFGLNFTHYSVYFWRQRNLLLINLRESEWEKLTCIKLNMWGKVHNIRRGRKEYITLVCCLLCSGDNQWPFEETTTPLFFHVQKFRPTKWNHIPKITQL